MLEIIDELHEGRVVGERYRLERVVGEGGMGVVWAATHVLTGKACALKFLKESRAADPRSHARMLNEARAACRVRHPNIAAVHDILELPSGVPFIVMDLLRGEPLSARLTVGRLDRTDAGAILTAIVDAVSAAHSVNIVHRDLKPENVFLEQSGSGGEQVFVLDFGVAKLSGDTVEAARSTVADAGSMTKLTTTFSAVGTPMYMAPEQIMGDREINASADAWAVGMIAFECFAGERPVRGSPHGEVDRRATARSLRAASPFLSRTFVEIVLDLLSPDPADRPELHVLRRALADLDAESPTMRGRSEKSRRRYAPFGLAALVVVLAAGAFVASARSRPERVADDASTEVHRPPLSFAPSVSEPDPVGSAQIGAPTASARTAPNARPAPTRTPPSKSTGASVHPTSSSTGAPSLPAVEEEGIPAYERH